MIVVKPRPEGIINHLKTEVKVYIIITQVVKEIFFALNVIILLTCFHVVNSLCFGIKQLINHGSKMKAT